MITAGFTGRLGNKMFQFAACYGIAAKTGHKIITPPWEGQTFFDLPAHTVGVPGPEYKNLPEDHPQTFSESVFSVPDGTRLEGYRQCERYFRHVREDVLRMFTLKEPYQVKLDEYMKQFTKPVLAIHSRETDYGEEDRVTSDYFRRAIDVVTTRSGIPIEGYDVVFASDNPGSSRLNLNQPVHRPALESQVVMQIFSRASACIIPASTFSWWGTWLNPRAYEMPVVGPNCWINCRRRHKGWYPVHIGVPEWTYIDV